MFGLLKESSQKKWTPPDGVHFNSDKKVFSVLNENGSHPIFTYINPEVTENDQPLPERSINYVKIYLRKIETMVRIAIANSNTLDKNTLMNFVQNRGQTEYLDMLEKYNLQNTEPEMIIKALEEISTIPAVSYSGETIYIKPEINQLDNIMTTIDSRITAMRGLVQIIELDKIKKT